MSVMKLILASNSPRRKQILSENGYEFSIIKSNFDEINVELNPVSTAISNASGKAKEVFNNLSESERENSVVLGADTVVFYNNKILGKPKDELDAYNTLSMLSNNIHSVVTGFSIICKNYEYSDYDLSKVKFFKLEKEEIERYIKSKNPMDKAGSYGIQDGFKIVESYEGSLSNIIGLPKEKVFPILDEKLKK